MSKHTPGPWNIGTKNGARVWSENGETLIADADASESLRKEIKKANARLIAAAPDLLEALTKLLDMNERCDAGFAPHVELRFAIRDMARAAITKATGEQP
jgi:hypothetical protein